MDKLIKSKPIKNKMLISKEWEKEIIKDLGIIELLKVRRSLCDDCFGAILYSNNGFVFRYSLYAGTLFVDGDFGILGLSWGFTSESIFILLIEALNDRGYQYLYSKIKTMNGTNCNYYKRRNKIYIDYYLVGLKLALNKINQELKKGDRE